MAIVVWADAGNGPVEVAAVAEGMAAPLQTIGPGTLFNVWCGVRPIVVAWVLRGLARDGLAATTPLGEVLPEPLRSIRHLQRWTVADVADHRAALPRIGLLESQLWGGASESTTLDRFAAWGRQDRVAARDYGEYAGSFLLEAIGRERGYLDDLSHGLSAGIVFPTAGTGPRAPAEDLGCYFAPAVRGFLPLPHDLLPGMQVDRPLSLGGYASARGLAAWWASWLSASQRPGPVLPTGAVSEAGSWYSKALLRDVEFDQGAFVDFGSYLGVAACSKATFGHVGWSGVSVGLLDPAVGVAVGLVLNGLDVGHDRFFDARRELLEWALGRGRAHVEANR